MIHNKYHKGHLSNDSGKTFLCGTTLKSILRGQEGYMPVYDRNEGLGSVWYKNKYSSECICVECSNHPINVMYELKYSKL